MTRKPRLSAAVPLLLWLWTTWQAAAAVQLDLFAGYDGKVHAGSWFPVAIEVFNDGATLEGSFEVLGGRFGNQEQRFKEQLPGGTRKRFLMTVFAGSLNSAEVTVRLADARGKTIAERQQPLVVVAADVPLLGAIAEGVSGMPRFPEQQDQQPERIPSVGRLETAYLPDNAVALEGLNTLYLNAAQASRISTPQADAVLGWLNAGGHLILALEQVPDLAAARWLRPLMPLAPSGSTRVRPGDALQRWLLRGPARPTHALAAPEAYDARLSRPGGRKDKNDSSRYFQDLIGDPSVAEADTAVVTGAIAPGSTVILAESITPLVVTRAHGRGRVTLLTFNPEREPVKSWRLNRQFWAALAGVPAPLLNGHAWTDPGAASLDAVFASMIETRQVRKLPVGVLLLMLVVYLVVIGPFDRWLVRRLGRPMLTWITFPAFVALFSVLVYWIGFKLRAGQTEWTELHVVDVLPMAGTNTGSGLRGRTYTSLYSPVNATYDLRLAQPSAGFRREYDGFGTGGGEARLTSSPGPESCDAGVFVPVWTSQMNVAEWTSFAEAPLAATISSLGGSRTVEVVNRGMEPLAQVWIVSRDGVFGASQPVPPAGIRDFGLEGGNSLGTLVDNQLARFQEAADYRRQVFGEMQDRARIDNWAEASIAASFIGSRRKGPGSEDESPNFNRYGRIDRNFAAMNGLDLSAAVARGDIVVFAWVENGSPLPPINRFKALRTRRATLYRLALSADSAAPKIP